MAESKKSIASATISKDEYARIRAEILAEIEAEKKTDKAKENAHDEWLEEYVERTLFYDGDKYKDDVSVCVNGENCVIKRGVPVKLKRKFALVLDESDMQDKSCARYARRMQEDFRRQSAENHI